MLAQDWKVQMCYVPPQENLLSVLYSFLTLKVSSARHVYYSQRRKLQKPRPLQCWPSVLNAASGLGCNNKFHPNGHGKGNAESKPKDYGLPYFLSVLITASYEIITMQSTGDRDTSKGPPATITERHKRQCFKKKKTKVRDNNMHM